MADKRAGLELSKRGMAHNHISIAFNTSNFPFCIPRQYGYSMECLWLRVRRQHAVNIRGTNIAAEHHKDQLLDKQLQQRKVIQKQETGFVEENESVIANQRPG